MPVLHRIAALTFIGGRGIDLDVPRKTALAGRLRDESRQHSATVLPRGFERRGGLVESARFGMPRSRLAEDRAALRAREDDRPVEEKLLEQGVAREVAERVGLLDEALAESGTRASVHHLDPGEASGLDGLADVVGECRHRREGGPGEWAWSPFVSPGPSGTNSGIDVLRLVLGEPVEVGNT